ncbi:MAG: aminopeptidase P family protein [Deltaproteobacteria bacterium]|nr:aminopeptidase P family protein [Deltaproteobacteria bacterium]
MAQYMNRIDRLRERLDESRLDGLLVSIPYNRYYVSGFAADDPQVMEISGFVLVGRDTRAILTDGRYATQARNESPDFQVYVYTADLLPTFQEAVSKANIRRLGIESRHLSVYLFDKLSEGLGQKNVELVKTEDVVEPLRSIKDPDELDRVVAALRVTEKAFKEVLEQLRPGMTEREVASMIESAMTASGAQGVAFDSIVASGPNAAMPHAVPTDRNIREGEPIIFDIGARKDMYCSDMSRTVFLGEPDERFREIYGIVRKAQLRAIEGLKPGMKTDEADALARDVIDQAGYGEFFLHSLGHGVGIATHEPPSLRRIFPVELTENMVITIEPGIYLPEWGGVRLEEMVVIRKNGAELLNEEKTFYRFDEER